MPATWAAGTGRIISPAALDREPLVMAYPPANLLLAGVMRCGAPAMLPEGGNEEMAPATGGYVPAAGVTGTYSTALGAEAEMTLGC
mmetsp:Transcript_60809/g.110873  ORF Transcript_60809/g.110873 Transcript_60809/m.110873 type:complete len:86 (+) Transcript_60809:225-482(+)